MVKPIIRVSAIDEERFGVRTVQARGIDRDSVVRLEQFSQDNQAQLAIVRVDADDLDAVHQLETLGYHLMDTLLYYAFHFDKATIPSVENPYLIRPVNRNTEAEAVARVSADSFRAYGGHYHADRRLNRADCDAVYESWAENSVHSPQVANEVLVMVDEQSIIGFATLRLNTPEEGEGMLLAIAPSYQRRGLYPSLVIRSLEWFKSQGASRMVISTQVTNIPPQKVWARLGFEFDHAYYTFHKWFD